MAKEQSQDLPGMDHRSIKPLDDLAVGYADIRDRRQALTQEEVQLKSLILAAMKRHKKDYYKRDGIEIRIIPGDEEVKVKVRKPSADDDADAEATDA